MFPKQAHAQGCVTIWYLTIVLMVSAKGLGHIRSDLALNAPNLCHQTQCTAFNVLTRELDEEFWA